jgi:arginine-tRNA-protein transferase
MDMGFRRSGLTIHRPACEGCRECVPIRVPVDRFQPSRSQRRVLRRNTDVRVEIDRPVCNEQKWRIFRDYLKHQHDDTMSDDYIDFEAFLYASPTETLEMTFRLGDAIVAAGIVDVGSECLSSVYFYFDPAHSRRSLGVFGALCEIEECVRRGLPYWYIGFYIRDCRRMNYKADFRPNERLMLDGAWREGVEGE